MPPDRRRRAHHQADFPPELRQVGVPEIGPAGQTVIGQVHLLSDNKHVLHVVRPAHRTARRFRMQIWQGSRPMKINRLIFIRAR